jgi:cytochrome c
MLTMHYSIKLLSCAALVCAANAAPAQDATAGKAAFAPCAACHSVNGSNGAGPSLQGVVGRKAGVFEGFRYSRAMKAAGTTWDVASLDAYIADPQKAIPAVLRHARCEGARRHRGLSRHAEVAHRLLRSRHWFGLVNIPVIDLRLAGRHRHT